MTTVAVMRDDNKFRTLDGVLELSGFSQVLLESYARSGKSDRDAFSIVIKPNMMVLTNQTEHRAVTTDVELVLHLIRWMQNLGFRNIKVVEAQNVLAMWLKGHSVKRVARLNGYSGDGYTIVDLTHEAVRCKYRWRDKAGIPRIWKHKVGKSWRDADFRISFAKCKSHESDYFTLCVKNVYGCFPLRDKHQQYHILREVPDVTAASVWTFPIHFGVIDAFVASDGYQGYKTQKNPKELKMMFASPDAICVDMECARRAGVDPKKMHILRRLVEFAHDGKYPEYEVVGDQKTMFTDIVPKWDNITDEIVETQDFTEESVIISGLMNVNAVDYIDFGLFPPRNFFWRLAIILMRWINDLRKLVNRIVGRRVW